jgi:hypothetical protein
MRLETHQPMDPVAIGETLHDIVFVLTTRTSKFLVTPT